MYVGSRGGKCRGGGGTENEREGPEGRRAERQEEGKIEREKVRGEEGCEHGVVGIVWSRRRRSGGAAVL